MPKLEYIWVGGNGELRSKVKYIDLDVDYTSIDDIPQWNYDGSSTNQAMGYNSEVLLRPVRVYKDPFSFNNDDRLVLCETYLTDGYPHPTNTRHIANERFKELDSDKHKPLFGVEHEFFVYDDNTNKPLGFPSNGYPNPQGQYYCSVGNKNAFGRTFLYECLDSAIDAGIKCTGCNLEVCPGQMEIQICNYGINVGDDSIMLKYILNRMGEKYNYSIDFSAKPIKGDWNGSGCHVNFSTEGTRNENGYGVIMKYMDKLRENHSEHIKVYGDDNNERLTGNHETSDINKFTYGIADRGASIRIPTNTYHDQCGYFEDRRPSSSADMYIVTSKIYKTCIE